MGGSASIRGYIIQTIIALLKSLNQYEWQYIWLEPAEESEKVDIKIETKDETIVTQVKSTKNRFYEGDLKKYTKDLNKNFKKVTKYELVLIGEISEKAVNIQSLNDVEISNPYPEINIRKMLVDAAELIKPVIEKHVGKKIDLNFCVKTCEMIAFEFLEFSIFAKQISRKEFIDLIKRWIDNARKIFVNNPFASFDEQFSNFKDPTQPFNHTYPFVGRENYIQQFENFLESDKAIVVLYGVGGIGKTKLIYEFFRQHPAFQKHFLSLDHPLTEISDSMYTYVNDNSILLVDDSHLRISYHDIFNLLAAKPNLKLILSLRPQGLDSLKNQLHKRNFTSDKFSILLELKHLELPERKELVERITEIRDIQIISRICNFAKESTLVLILTSFYFKNSQLSLKDLVNEDDFKAQILSKFLEKSIQLDLAEISINKQTMDDFLFIISLIEPLNYLNPEIKKKLCTYLKITKNELISMREILLNAGILYTQGYLMRISPDIFSDYIIEKRLSLEKPELNEIINEISKLFPESLANIARVDYIFQRESLIDITKVWKNAFTSVSLSEKFTILSLLSKISLYKPSISIDIGKICVQEESDTNLLRSYVQVLNSIYSIDYLDEVFKLSWILHQKLEKVEIFYESNKPLSVIAKFTKFNTTIPLRYNEKALDFLQNILIDEKRTNYLLDCLNLIKQLLNRTIYSHTSFDPATMHTQMVPVSYENTKALRNRAIRLLSKYISHDSLQVSKKVIEILTDLLRSVNYRTDDEIWNVERLIIIEIVLQKFPELNPLIQVLTKDIISHVIDLHFVSSELKTDIGNKILDFHTFDTMFYECVMENRYYPRERTNQVQELCKAVSKEMIAKYPQYGPRMAHFDELLAYFQDLYPDTDTYTRYNFDLFVEQVLPLTKDDASFLSLKIINSEHPNLKPILQHFLVLARQESRRVFQKITKQIFISKDSTLYNQLTLCYTTPSITNPEKTNLLKLSKINDAAVKLNYVKLLRALQHRNFELFIEIYLKLHFSIQDQEAIKEYGYIFDKKFVATLSNKELKKILRKFQNLKSLNHNNITINQFIRHCLQVIPFFTLNFLVKRMRKSSIECAVPSVVLSPGIYTGINIEEILLRKIRGKLYFYLLLSEIFGGFQVYRLIHKKFERIIRITLFKKEFPAYRICSRLPYLYQLVGKNKKVALDIIEEWIYSKNYAKFYIACHLLDTFPNSFILDYRDWVCSLIRKKENFSKTFYSYLKSHLFLLGTKLTSQGVSTPLEPDENHLKSVEQLKIITNELKSPQDIQSRFFFQELVEFITESINRHLQRERSELI